MILEELYKYLRKLAIRLGELIYIEGSQTQKNPKNPLVFYQYYSHCYVEPEHPP